MAKDEKRWRRRALHPRPASGAASAPPIRSPRRARRGLAALAAAGLLLLVEVGCSEAPAGGSEPAGPGPLAKAEYVDPAACNGCHSDIWQTYSQTGMGRSFQRLRPGGRAYAASTPYYHAASDRHYEMALRDGRYFQRRFQTDSAGAEVNVLEKEAHFVMGSGSHARTFLHLSPSGKLSQLPLGWYAEGGGRWRMSPGYDRRNHDGFQRVIAYDCMFCHNGYPEVPAGQDLPGRRPLYRGAIPEGIDCQRCHGPGSVHVQAMTEDPDRADASSSIVNPARLPAARRDEVCFQCHLEPTSRPLPNILHKYGRGYFSYRPGQPLADYAIYFDHAPGTGWDGKFEINHAAYRLRQSPCVTREGRPIGCTACHDPHQSSSSEAARRRYAEVCSGCHSGPLAALPSDARHRSGSDCVRCHMPQRRTDDVVHAVMTDHRIQAVAPQGLLRPKRERSAAAEAAYRGEVVLHYPPQLPARDGALYGALAQTAQGSNVDAGAARLASAIERHAPAEAGFYLEMGAALEELGRLAEAALWYERSLAKAPGFVLAWIRLGSVLSRSSEHQRAQEAFRRAGALDPRDPRVPKETGLDLARQGRFDEAAAVSRRGIPLDPDLPELHNNLGGALAELGRFDEAQAALREAVRLQPDLAEAQFNLGSVLAARGDLAGAVERWRAAVRSQPDYSAAHFNLAVIEARRGDVESALGHLEAALGADPGFERAEDLRNQLTASAGGGR